MSRPLEWWRRLDPATRIPLLGGTVLGLAGIFLPLWLAVIIGLVAIAALAIRYPDNANRVGVLFALPAMVLLFLFFRVRGISTFLLLLILLPSFILPVAVARIAAGVRSDDDPSAA